MREDLDTLVWQLCSLGLDILIKFHPLSGAWCLFSLMASQLQPEIVEDMYDYVIPLRVVGQLIYDGDALLRGGGGNSRVQEIFRGKCYVSWG